MFVAKLSKALDEARKIDNVAHIQDELLSNRTMDIACSGTTDAHQIEAACIAEATPFDGSASSGGPRGDAGSEQNLVSVERRAAASTSSTRKK
jgi:hypothetical protein